MTRFAGDHIQRCNQCRAPYSYYCAACDEWLCEECEPYALQLAAVEKEMAIEPRAH